MLNSSTNTSDKKQSQPSWPRAVVLGVLVAVLVVVTTTLLVVLVARVAPFEHLAEPMIVEQARQWSEWIEGESPNYYRVVGAAQRDSFHEPSEPGIRYSELDALGRAGSAWGCITYDMMREGLAREREDMSSLEPSGWGHNTKVTIAMPNGNEYHGYLFNRSHLIAKSLGGADILENVVCATRTQNVGANDGEGGMSYPEGLARSWLEQHPQGQLFYAATPLYEEGELVCRSVMVDMLASDGSIDARFEVYNTAKGFALNYADGSFVEDGR